MCIRDSVQKASHLREDRLPEDQRTPYFKRKSWWLGFLCTIAGSVMDFLALGLASQSLVAALGGGTTLVTNVLVASLYNKEATYWTDIVGVVFIMGGAALFAVTAESKPKHVDYQSQFFRTYFLIYLGIQCFVIMVLLSSITRSHWSNLRREYYNSLIEPVQERVTSLESQVSALKSVLQDLLVLEQGTGRSTEYQAKLVPLLQSLDDCETEPSPIEYQKRDKYIYAMCGGAVGALSILFGAVVSSMVQSDPTVAFTSWFFYMSLGIMLASVISQTHLQNRSLEIGDATAVFPVFEAFWISFGVISGLVYNNSPGTSWGSDLKQLSGILPMLVGIIFLFLHQDTMRPLVESMEDRLSSVRDTLATPFSEELEVMHEPLNIEIPTDPQSQSSYVLYKEAAPSKTACDEHPSHNPSLL
eukprot:TRINITY_DN60539_c0_g1_i2.p1 TRINITY_DN60539_c0_g1~~TRINITY_DN60539_c0_g1_i2.p1  ORF type:complete len:416 (-),score=89.43 TRINITY_DN60539_c0_g1_i2:100-1347(-)